MKKLDLRYLKTYEQYRMINEEEEGWKEWALAGLMAVSSLFGGGKAMGRSVSSMDGGPKTEITQKTKASNVFTAKILMGTTSEEKCYNDVLVKFGLDWSKSDGYDSNTRFYKATVGDIISAMESGDSTKILSNFELITPQEAGVRNLQKDKNGNDVTDYISVGGKSILNDGKLSFNFSDPNQEIVASGNGLLALTRIARQGFGFNSEDAFAAVQFNLPRESKSVDITINFDKAGVYKALFYAFETATTPADKYVGENTYAHIYNMDDLIGASENESVDFIYGLLIGGAHNYIPSSFYSDSDLITYLQENGYQLPEKSVIAKYLSKFKSDGITDSDMNQIIALFNKVYERGLSKFANDNLGQEAAEDILNQAKEHLQTLKFDVWKNYVSGNSGEYFHSWNSTKTTVGGERVERSDIKTDKKIYKIGENKRHRNI